MIRVRCGTPVTTGIGMTPEHIASSFVFDTGTLQLYLDLNNGTRKPVRDPLILQEIEENGIVTRSIQVKDDGGIHASNIRMGSDGYLTFDTPLLMEMVEYERGQTGDPDYRVAVFDEDGHLQYVTFEDLASDIAMHYTQLDVEMTTVVNGLSHDYNSELLTISLATEDVVKSVRIRT